MIDFTPRSVVKESAAEVKAKLRSDLTRWVRVRRAVSIKPMVGCVACDAAGHLACESCGGTGKSKVVLNEKQEDCPHCDGKGQVTCVQCAGVGLIPNTRRKTILWLLAVGGVCWLFALWILMGRDVMPEQRSRYLAGGGGGGTIAGRTAPQHAAPGPAAPTDRSAAPQGIGGAPPTGSSPTPVLPQRDYRRSAPGATPSAGGPMMGGPGFGTPMPGRR